MISYYKFTTKDPSNKLFFFIEQFNADKKKILIATQIGKKINFTTATIIKLFFKYPLMTYKVILGIHYQAIIIFFKGKKYYSRKKKPDDTISFEGML